VVNKEIEKPATQKVVETSPTKKEEVSPTEDKRKLLIVALFDNKSQTAELDWLKLGLTDMAIAKLSQERELRVLSRQEIIRILKNHQDTPEEILLNVAKSRHADWILWGSYALYGNTIQLNLTLESVADGKVIASISEDKQKDESLITGMDEMMLKLREKLALSQSTQGLKTVAELRTSSPEAYYDYIQGIQDYNDEYIDKSIERLKHAIQLDPNFVMAYMSLAEVYNYMDDRKSAKFYTQKAIDLSKGRTEEESLYVQAFKAYLDNDMSRALVLYRKIAETSPRDVLIQSSYIEMLMYNGQMEEALKVCNWVEKLDPSFPKTKLLESYILSDLDRDEEAIRAAKEYMQLLPNSPIPLEMAGDIYRRAGQWENALAVLEKSKNLRVTRWVNDQIFKVYMDMGQLRKAEAHVNETDIKSDDVILKANAYYNLALIAETRGEYSKAKANVEESLKFEPNYITIKGLLGMEYAREGNIEAARKVLAEIELLDALAWERSVPDELRGYIFFFQQNDKEARKYFEKAKQAKDFYDRTSLDYDRKIIESYLSEGDMSAAISLAETLIQTKWHNAHLRLLYARALEGEGKTEDALKNYRKLLDVWKNADPDHPYIIFSKERVKELENQSK
jgi:tetratricopeptide (TPR) repeat protein